LKDEIEGKSKLENEKKILNSTKLTCQTHNPGHDIKIATCKLTQGEKLIAILVSV
jgi:hypothetical protein